MLHTRDAGEEWDAIEVLLSAQLRSLATLDPGPVRVGGVRAVLVTTNGGSSWTGYGDDRTRVRSLTGGARVFALPDDGALWIFAGGVLARRMTQPGARAVHATIGGDVVMAAGCGIAPRSRDVDTTWVAFRSGFSSGATSTSMPAAGRATRAPTRRCRLGARRTR